jgi:hypothetical protein
MCSLRRAGMGERGVKEERYRYERKEGRSKEQGARGQATDDR